MANKESMTEIKIKQGNALTRFLDGRFHFTERGSRMGVEIRAGLSGFFAAVCALLMNTALIGRYYGNYAGPYFALTLLCLIGTVVIGMIANLPLIVSGNMGFSAVLLSMMGAYSGLSYANMMALTFVAALVYVLILFTPVKKMLLDAVPDPVRKTLPAAIGAYVIFMALHNAGLTGSDGGHVHPASLSTLQRFFAVIMMLGALLYLWHRVRKNETPLYKTFLFMVVVMWVGGILFFLDYFFGGQTAATVVYERLNLITATDGASPYTLGIGASSAGFFSLLSQGFDFSAYTAAGGNVFLLFVQGILVFASLGLYTNFGMTEATASLGDMEDEAYYTENSVKAQKIGGLLQLASPLFGLPPVSVGAQSCVSAKDGAKTGLASLAAGIGYLIALFNWVFFAIFATETHGVGMWIEQTETKLAAYVQDRFAFADLIMILCGVALLTTIRKVSLKEHAEKLAFAATIGATLLTQNLAAGVAAGSMAYVLTKKFGEEKEKSKAVSLAPVLLMLVILIPQLYTGSATGSTAQAQSTQPLAQNAQSEQSGAAAQANETLGEVTNFTFDFETGDYAFTGTENAEFYYIRVFSVKDGQESNSAELQSDRIPLSESNSYSGNIGETLKAGTYNAYVMAAGSGYQSSYTRAEGNVTRMSNPSVEAVWKEEGEGEDASVSVEITLTPGDNVSSSFAVAVLDEEETVLWEDERVQSATIVLSAQDLGRESLSKEDRLRVAVSVNPEAGFEAPAEGVTEDVTERQMGGPMGGGMAGFEVEPEPVSFAEGEEEFEFIMGEHQYFHTTAYLAPDPDPGALYTYLLSKGDAQAPFDADMRLQIMEDGRAIAQTSAEGPIAAAEVEGSWESDGTTITVTW